MKMQLISLAVALFGSLIGAGRLGAQEQPELEVRARALVAAMAEGRWEDAAADFDAQLQAVLPPPKLAEAWQTITMQFGSFGGIRGAQIIERPPLRAVILDAAFDRAPLDVRVVFDNEEQVAGLFFTPRAAPPPPAEQTVPPDAPYTPEEVRVPTPAGYELAGTLTLPKEAPGPVPAVVLISGSGPQDRDGAIPGVPGYHPFRQIADALGRRGIAVLRLDDRGFGASGGDPSRATTADLADDARAALEFLRGRGDIDPERLALIGHSEGGIIAPMVAAADPGLAGIVLMAGSSRTGREILSYQQTNAVGRDSTLSPAEQDSLRAELAARTDSAARNTPWLRFFLDYDPLTTAREVGVPVLILQGATDRQVSAEQAEELGAGFRTGGNADVTVRVFPDLNHLFLPDPDGTADVGRYAALPSKEVPAEVLDTLAKWLAERLR